MVLHGMTPVCPDDEGRCPTPVVRRPFDSSAQTDLGCDLVPLPIAEGEQLARDGQRDRAVLGAFQRGICHHRLQRQRAVEVREFRPAA